tara:strand:- start:512 stop:691 length:180 start_codon:yes stop_codon:yes gene_type:complete
MTAFLIAQRINLQHQPAKRADYISDHFLRIVLTLLLKTLPMLIQLLTVKIYSLLLRISA